MKSILLHVVYILVIYIIGVATSKNLRLFLVKFRADPKGAIDNEIAELRKLADRLKGGA